MPLLLDGTTTLAEALGVKATGKRGEMKHYDWEDYAQDSVELPRRLAYPNIKVGAAFKVLANNSRSPVVVSGSRGKGRFIYSAIPLEPQEGMVFQYLPFLAQAIADELHIVPALAADNLCVYIDPGADPQRRSSGDHGATEELVCPRSPSRGFLRLGRIQDVYAALYRRGASRRDCCLCLAGIPHGQPGVLGPASGMARGDGQRTSGHHGLAP